MMMKKIRNLCGTIFLGFCLWWLPNGNRMKDGASQQLARVTCAAFLLLLCMSDFSLRNRGNQTTLFFERYVGPASARSLAAMRISCSVLLLTFTSDHMTSPLAATAQVPRWMCRPTGIIRLLNECGVLGGLFEDARSLWRLEQLTRAALGCVAMGLGTPVVAPCASILWLFYGGVLRAYNTWRGHSFIAAWWTLVVLAWRGGAADAASLDSCLCALYEDAKLANVARGRWWTAGRSSHWNRRFSRPLPHTHATELARAADRGWTRFLVTLIFANNYLMAGLSKLCASGVAWASGDNLKAKLLQTTLTQTSFGCYLTLFCRRFPDTFFGALGACGLYGEIAMGLVPFFSFAKLLLPIAMWGMHVSIAALQHIIFVDLLFFIPAWYIWHVIDRNPGKLRPLAHAQHPWDWTQWVDDIHACWLKARAFSQGPRLFQATPRESAAILDNNHLKDKNLPDLPEDLPTPKAVVLDANPSLPHEDIIHAGARQTLLFMLVFLGVWTRGAEWFPYNAFRMFAGWTSRPILYERYIALGGDGSRIRNFHYHEIHPALNRKRLVEAFNRCADEPESADCCV